MKNILLYMSFLVLLTSSCATFKKRASSDGKLTADQLYKINGTYNNLSEESRGAYVHPLTDIFDRDHYMFDFNKTGKYEKKKLSISLNVISSKRLNVKIYEGENLLFDKNIKVKLKKDGFLYVKEKKLIIDGIPFIFGGWNIQKSRISIDENNNLKIQYNYFFYRAALVFIGDAKTFHSTQTFKKH